jgi:methionyl-tRNA formyltransferase
MRIVFFGTPEFAAPSLQRLLAKPDLEVIATVTQPDKRRGRGAEMMPSAIKKIALARGLPVWQPQHLKKDKETLRQVEQAAADVFVVVAYGQLLPPAILALPKLGCINVHGSLLPKYRGAAPIQWCLYHGERETGITTMLMDEGMDTGAMLLKTRTPVGLLENGEEVASRLAQLGADLLLETLGKWERGEIEPIPQDSSQASYAPLIGKSDYELDWSLPALDLHNQVRGFFPDCLTTFRGKPLKVRATVPLGEEYRGELLPDLAKLDQRCAHLDLSSGRTGEVVSTLKGLGAVVQTGQGLLLLREVQLSGKRPQSGGDFVNGMRLSVGEVLG